MTLRCTKKDDGVWIDVRVAPRASRDKILGLHGDALKVALTAPPVDGAANQALIALMARQLGVAKRDVTLVRGQTARDKTVSVAGVSVEEVSERLASFL